MKILFLTDFYYPKPLANGICVRKIANVLSKEHEVSVLSFRGTNESDEYFLDGIKIYKVRSRLFYYLRDYGEANNNKILGKIVYKIAMLIQKIKKIMFIFYFPLTSPLFILRFYRKAKKICLEEKIDIVICTYNPLEAPIVGLLLKKRKIVKNNVLYVIDTLTNKYKKKNIIASIFSYFGWKWEKRFFSASDIIINMNCYKDSFENSRYKKFMNKIYFADIPYIENIENINLDKINDKEFNKFIYAGALIRNMRNPEKTCIIMNEFLKDHNNCELDFYSRGDCEDIIAKYCKLSNNKIKQFGYIKKEELDKVVLGNSIIITIGNKNSQMISSKIFEYIILNKKIIHFYSDLNDSSIPYLRKYPNCLLIFENDSVDMNVSKINDFCKKDITYLDFSDLKEIYKENTPEYTAEIIKKVIL